MAPSALQGVTCLLLRSSPQQHRDDHQVQAAWCLVAALHTLTVKLSSGRAEVESRLHDHQKQKLQPATV